MYESKVQQRSPEDSESAIRTCSKYVMYMYRHTQAQHLYPRTTLNNQNAAVGRSSSQSHPLCMNTSV